MALGSPTKALYSPRRRAVTTYPGGRLPRMLEFFWSVRRKYGRNLRSETTI